MRREEITKDKLREMYDEMLDECYPEVFNILPSTILEECDPIAYSLGLDEYYYSLEDDYYCEEME